MGIFVPAGGSAAHEGQILSSLDSLHHSPAMRNGQHLQRGWAGWLGGWEDVWCQDLKGKLAGDDFKPRLSPHSQSELLWSCWKSQKERSRSQQKSPHLSGATREAIPGREGPVQMHREGQRPFLLEMWLWNNQAQAPRRNLGRNSWL